MLHCRYLAQNVRLRPGSLTLAVRLDRSLPIRGNSTYKVSHVVQVTTNQQLGEVVKNCIIVLLEDKCSLRSFLFPEATDFLNSTGELCFY